MAAQKREARLPADVPAIHVLPCCIEQKDVNARVKPGHDDLSFQCLAQR
jgi:hypothetical protein